MRFTRGFIYRFLFFCALGMGIILFGPDIVRADLKSADVLKDSQWNMIVEYEIPNEDGKIQSLCVTNQYIVCCLDTENSAPDKLVAFYKNNTDENGNPVQQYSYAKTITEVDYEHANGMTYNPNSNEIIIAGSVPQNPDNQGCVFVVDAATLKFKQKVKISNEWNVKGISYCRETNQYIIQKVSNGQRDFAALDMDYKLVDEMEGIVERDLSRTYQDFEVCGDDIISLPYIKGESYNGTVSVFSRKQNAMVGEYQLSLEANSRVVEVESLGQLSPGQFVLGCNLKEPRRLALYTATLPMAYNINTAIENGEITESVAGVDLGSDCTISYTPIENFEVKKILVDGQKVSRKKNRESFTFGSVTEDHSIQVICKEIPQYPIETSAVNGTIDETQLIRRDKDVTLNFAPQEHYEVDCLYLDGERIEMERDATSYTLENIQGPHTVEVAFKKIPAFSITASAENGSVSAAKQYIYRDEDYKVTFAPKKDYILKAIYIDGVKLEGTTDETEFEFTNIQKRHDLYVVYTWRFWPLLIGIMIAMGVVMAGYLTLTVKRYHKHHGRRKERKEWKRKNDN